VTDTGGSRVTQGSLWLGFLTDRTINALLFVRNESYKQPKRSGWWSHISRESETGILRSEKKRIARGEMAVISKKLLVPLGTALAAILAKTPLASFASTVGPQGDVVGLGQESQKQTEGIFRRLVYQISGEEHVLLLRRSPSGSVLADHSSHASHGSHGSHSSHSSGS